MTLRLLAISGSLRARSTNGAVLRAAARLVPSGVEVIVYHGLRDLPHFDPDLDDAPPSRAAALRDEVGACDGLLVSVPEYAHGLPGSFKNALDWLVGSVTFPSKPVALLGTAPRAVHAPAQLREVLATMSACIVEEACLVLDLGGGSPDAAAILADALWSHRIASALEAFVAAIASGVALDTCA